MTAAGGSHIGLRKNNEDSYYINEDCKLLVIADGMGGHEHGQLASQLAVEQFVNHLRQETQSVCPEAFSIDQMEELFAKANQAVYQKQESLKSGIIGTTLTVAIVDGNQLYTGHVGDSRLYLYRDDELTQLTQDHSYYAELVRQGTDIPVENQKKNVLLKALGPEETVEGQFFQETLYKDDLLLLCTDGLYNAVGHSQLEQIVSNYIQNCDQAVELQHTVDQLIAQALEHGATDNITVILYKHE